MLVDQTKELNKDLQTIDQGAGLAAAVSTGDFLPSQPQVPLSDGAKLAEYVKKSLKVPALDKLAPTLWWIGTPHYAHISPLHHQAARGRNIVVVEDPLLHLVWYYDRVFMKPIPSYLLSHAFWEHLETNDPETCKAATGFLRTYSCLIQYETDFREVQENLHLIPQNNGTNDITFQAFSSFIAQFDGLGDDKVTPRYQYGELRLARLNALVRILFLKLTFHHIDAQWNVFLGRFLAPFLTIFLVLTTVLTAMQVELAAQSLSDESGPWLNFSRASRWFSVVVILIFMVAIVATLVLVLVTVIHDFLFARSVLHTKKTSLQDAAKMKPGVV